MYWRHRVRLSKLNCSCDLQDQKKGDDESSCICMNTGHILVRVVAPSSTAHSYFNVIVITLLDC